MILIKKRRPSEDLKVPESSGNGKQGFDPYARDRLNNILKGSQSKDEY